MPQKPNIFNHTDSRAFLRESHEYLKSVDSRFSHRFISQQGKSYFIGSMSTEGTGVVLHEGSTVMERNELLRQMDELPGEYQRQVLDFVGFLRDRYGRARPGARGKIRNEPFVGMWKSRKDMADSREWVRSVRRSEWAE